MGRPFEGRKKLEGTRASKRSQSRKGTSILSGVKKTGKFLKRNGSK